MVNQLEDSCVGWVREQGGRGDDGSGTRSFGFGSRRLGRMVQLSWGLAFELVPRTGIA
jgi:hypothetical protein